jgi:dipeptidyl-peptidase-4
MRSSRFVAIVSITIAIVAGTSAFAAAAQDWLTLDDLFGSDRLYSTDPDLVLWLPTGDELLFRDARDGVRGLFRHDVASGATERVVDWERLFSDLYAQRPQGSRPSMDDVNTHHDRGMSPSLDPAGRRLLGIAAGDLYLLELNTGSARFLTETDANERFATFSPDGSRVAFAHSGDLYTVDVGTGVETRLTDRAGDEAVLNGVSDWVYEEELDVERSFWWSPGGDRVLFVQYDTSPIAAFPITDELERVATVEWQRYPKAGDQNSTVRLGVVAAEGGPTVWIPTGVGDGYLARAGWIPGGREVWFEVLNRDQTRLELRAAVPGENSSRLLVADESPDWVNVRDDLTFVDDDLFVWSSERDGWRHLYLYDLSGRLVRRLTSGSWQVEAVYGLGGDGERVVFRANAEDPRERHSYDVGLTGGPVRLLTAEPGTHDAILAPDGRHFVDTYSNLDSPPRLDLYRGDGRRVRTVDDGVIPALAGVTLQLPELGTVAADDGTTLYSWMFRPPDFDPAKRYPVLLYVYGGPGAQLVVNEWGGTRLLYQQYLARKGLVVFTIDNRGTWGRGHEFEAAIHRRLGEIELADQLAGVRSLLAQPWVDPERIGVYGGSYGGYMALMAMHRAPDTFSAGIAYAPVTDWRLYDSIYTERYMDLPADNPDAYRDGSPISSAANLAGALLVCHGTMDNNVHFQHTVRLAGEYQKEGKLFDLMIYPRTRHGVRLSENRLHFHRLKTAFLERTLIRAVGVD